MSGKLPLTIVICEFADPNAVAALSAISRLVPVGVDRVSEIPELEPTALLVWHNVRIGEEFLIRCKSLRILIRMGVGYDNVDIVAAGKLGIAICNVPSYGTEEVADSALSHILNLHRRTVSLESWTHQNQALANAPETSRVAKGVTRIRGQKLGLVGLGRIGTAVCNRAKPFGFDISFFDPFLPSGVEKAHGIRRHYSFDELLAESDVVSFHCNLTAENRHMLNSSNVFKMKADSRLVNTARGGLIEEKALVATLEEGRLSGVALDVHEVEPFVRSESLLAKFERVYSLPHVAWFSEQSLEEMWQTAVSEVGRALHGQASHTDLRNCVNHHLIATNVERWKSVE